MCLTDQIDVTDSSALMMPSVLFSPKLSRQDRGFILKNHYDIVLTEAESKAIDLMGNVYEGFYEYGREDGLTEGKGLV